MPPSSWHERMRRALAERCLPPDRIERLMDELQDHYLDLMEENPHMETNSLTCRLGTPEQLAGVAAAEHRRRTFVGRHPIATFLVAPIPLAIGLIVAGVVSVAAVGSLMPDEAMHSESGIAVAAAGLATVSWALRLLPFALLAFAFSRVAFRTGCGWRWGFAAAVVLAAFAAVFAVDYQVPTAAPDSGRFSMGLALPIRPVQAVQFLAPIAIAAWLARRHCAATARVA